MQTSTVATVFNAYSRYYDLLYRDKDYATEVDYLDRLLQRHGLEGRELLEFGSGTGRHGRLLAERGYRVQGIELSETMVAQAQPADGFAIQQGDIRAVRLNTSYDAVVSLFHVISYQTGNDDVRAVFERAAEHLRPGGLFVFDVWYTPAVYAQRPSVRVKRMADEAIEVTRIAEPDFLPNENRVDVHYTVLVRDRATGLVETLRESHPMRHFSLPELDLLASMTGFERLNAEEFLTGAPPSESTWGVCLVLRKS